MPQIGAAAKEIAHAAVRAEQAGYESIWVSDHLEVPETGGRLPPLEILEPIATLAYAAALTRRIKLATSVIVVPYRNAIHLAKELAHARPAVVGARRRGGRQADGSKLSFARSAYRSKSAALTPTRLSP